MSIVKIESLHIKELDVYHEHSEPSLLHYYEPEPGVFIAESPMIVQRALDAGYEPISMLVEEKSTDFVEKILEHSGLESLKETAAQQNDNLPQNGKGNQGLTGRTAQIDQAEQAGLPGFDDIPVYVAPLEELKKITGFHLTRSVLCAMRRKKLPTVEQVISRARRIVVLDNVMNPTNAGAIFRSAAALGMDAVLLTKGSTDPLYRRAARVSMGTVFQIPWTFLEHWPEDIAILKKHGFTVTAMSLAENSVSLRDLRISPSDKIALVMGTEGPGLPAETVDACDLSVKIPMAHGVDSLNVAAASAVAFWSIV